MWQSAPPRWAMAFRSWSVFAMQTAVGYKLVTDYILSTTVVRFDFARSCGCVVIYHVSTH